MTVAPDALEFHDSGLLSIEHHSNGRGLLLLDAYVHHRLRNEGGMQKVQLVIDSMRIHGDAGLLPATIYREALTINGSRMLDLLPLPSQYEGDLSLILTLLDEARTVSITGNGMSVVPAGEFRYVEPLT